MNDEVSLREHLLALLQGKGAHIPFDRVVEAWPQDDRGTKPPGAPHNAGQLVEHLRIAQWDILEFSRSADHKSPGFPEGYWPQPEVPDSPAAWERSLEAFRSDGTAIRALVSDPERSLFQPFPWGTARLCCARRSSWRTTTRITSVSSLSSGSCCESTLDGIFQEASGKRRRSRAERYPEGSPSRYIARISEETGREISGEIDPDELLVHAHRDHHPIEVAAQFLASRVIHFTGQERTVRRGLRALDSLGVAAAEAIGGLIGSDAIAKRAKRLIGVAHRDSRFRFREPSQLSERELAVGSSGSSARRPRRSRRGGRAPVFTCC